MPFDQAQALFNSGQLGSRGVGYQTIDELKAKEKVIKCTSCGGMDSTHYANKDKLRKNKVCFRCQFWLDIIEKKHEHVIIDGKSYFIAAENHPSNFRGFSGRKFVIEMLADGKRVTTTNLWYQGEIPQRFRDQLPDTGKFIS